MYSFNIIGIFRNGENFYENMKSLTAVKRFSMTVMFFSHKEKKGISLVFYITKMTLSFRTDTCRFGKTVQTQIRLLLEEQSDQGLHCLLFHLRLFDKILYGLASLFEF